LISAFILILPLFVDSAGLQPAPSYTGGYLDFSLSSRVFELPLFGSSSPVSFLFLGSQVFSTGLNLSVWLDTGFPNSTTGIGIEASHMPFLKGLLDFRGGDLKLRTLGPENFLSLNQDSFPVQGLGLEYTSSRLQWALSGGKAKYSQEGPNLDGTDRPTLFQGEILRRLRHNDLGLAITGVRDPVFADGDVRKSWSSAVTGRFYHQFSPVSVFSSAVLLGQNGSVGGNAGYQHNFQTGELGVSIYSFGDGFPYLPPVFRPGERGAEIGGRYYISERSVLFGRINYYEDHLVQLRSDFRGYVGYGWSLGDSRPYMQFSYYRNEIDFDPLSISTNRSSVTDRLTFLVSRASFGAFSNLRMEHLFGNGMRSRTQASYDFRRPFHERSFLNGSFLAQREDGSGFGFTAESSLERPWKQGYFYLVGFGVAHRHVNGDDTAEGIARFGFSRRIFQNGWRAQVEFVVPFPVGLPRSNLSQRQILFNLGQNFSWKSIESLKAIFSPSGNVQYGSIEGVIYNEKNGIQGIAILVNGEPKAIIGSDGRFKIGRVPAGPATLSLDIRKLDPGISILGGPVRDVFVQPGETTRVDFAAAILIYFQGAVIVCDQGKHRPARGVEVKLVGKDFSSSTVTSDVGGFQFDQIPPGVYRLSMDLSSMGINKNQVPTIGIVLNQDVLGYVIKVNCL